MQEKKDDGVVGAAGASDQLKKTEMKLDKQKVRNYKKGIDINNTR